MFKRIIFNLTIASEAILANKMRAILTALGIIFGVAAVIAMLAVGNGAQKEILEQIKLVGVNNIIVTAIIEKSDPTAGNDGKEQKQKFSPGLTLADAEAISSTIPGLVAVNSEIIVETNIVKDGRQVRSKLVGVSPAYFSLVNLKAVQGQLFSPSQMEQGAAVCVIGQGIRSRFFSQSDPIGSRIKCGNQWLTVVGVLESRTVSESAATNLGIRNYDMDVYTPISTALIRYTNRNTLTKAMIQQSDMDDDEDEKKEKKAVNYHQIDRIVIQIEDTDKLASTAELVARILQRRHLGVTDYEVSIPELLLKQQQRTKDIFNIVLGVIASISLVVGGIGIMNIMLASVLERIKEIGLRISLGAKKSDIVLQFMCEAMLISISGGLIGIALGVVLAIGISQLADIPTIVSGTSVALSFLVAASVGLIFGITPAKRASEQDPITCLRYE